jgi:hypothetical protein
LWQDGTKERAAAVGLGRKAGNAADATAVPRMRIARARGIGFAIIRASSSRKSLIPQPTEPSG